MNWKLCVTNQTAADNHEGKTCHETPEPRKTAQSREKRKEFLCHHSNEDGDENAPVLKECLQAVGVTPTIHINASR